jgi:hypothetical protein
VYGIRRSLSGLSEVQRAPAVHPRLHRSHPQRCRPIARQSGNHRRLGSLLAGFCRHGRKPQVIAQHIGVSYDFQRQLHDRSTQHCSAGQYRAARNAIDSKNGCARDWRNRIYRAISNSPARRHRLFRWCVPSWAIASRFAGISTVTGTIFPSLISGPISSSILFWLREHRPRS